MYETGATLYVTWPEISNPYVTEQPIRILDGMFFSIRDQGGLYVTSKMLNFSIRNSVSFKKCT